MEEEWWRWRSGREGSVHRQNSGIGGWPHGTLCQPPWVSIRSTGWDLLMDNESHHRSHSSLPSCQRQPPSQFRMTARSSSPGEPLVLAFAAPTPENGNKASSWTGVGRGERVKAVLRLLTPTRTWTRATGQQWPPVWPCLCFKARNHSYFSLSISNECSF